MNREKGSRTGRPWSVWAAVAAVLLSGASAAGAGSRAAVQSERGGRAASLEAVSPEDVAPEDRDSRADAVAKPARGPADPKGGHRSARGEALASLGQELRRLWRSIPAYSPVNGTSRLTSGFGWRAGPFGGKREFHGGIDLAGARGTAIVAPADGFVERAYLDDTSGLVVVLEHGNGMETIYAHLDRILVWEGKEVARGETIGILGSSGWRSTGPHLHYGIKVEGKFVNPRRYLFEEENPAERSDSR